MTKKLLVVLFSSLVGLTYAQPITISGYVNDETSNERLIGANIYDINHKIGTTTNEHGFYSITIPNKSEVNLQFSYIGYQTDTLLFHLLNDSIVNVSLSPFVTLEEVEVVASH